MGYRHTVFAVATTGFGRGVAAEPIDDGLAAFQSEDYARALEILLPMAEAGNLEASYTVGVIYDFGRGVNQDDMTAGTWYRIAADALKAKYWDLYVVPFQK